MCPSRLPNEVTSYRPSGMLDRDQRTAFTIHRIRDGPSSSSSSSIIPTSTTTTMASSTSIHRNSRLNTNLNSNHQCNNNSMNTLVDIKDDQLSEAYKNKCDCQQQTNTSGSLWEDSSSMASIHLARKYKTTSGYYRSRTKFANYLLVFTCIWLALIRHTCAYPLPRAAMSGDSQDPETQRCRAINDALNKPIEQARIASNYIRGLLDDYTQAQFNKKPSDLHELWRNHPAHFSYGLNIENYLPQNLDSQLPQQYFEHLHGEGVPSENELSMEFQRIYSCLQTLKKVFHAILEDRKNNASRIMHDLQNDRKTHDAINHLFEEQFRYSNLDITEIEIAMTALNIPYPELEELRLGEKDRTIGEWLATREYLKVLRYVAEAYDILQQRCSSL